MREERVWDIRGREGDGEGGEWGDIRGREVYGEGGEGLGYKGERVRW